MTLARGQAFVFKSLVLEEDPGSSAFMSRVLFSQGLVANQGHDGKDGLKSAYGLQPHLIISDIKLPEISG